MSKAKILKAYDLNEGQTVKFGDIEYIVRQVTFFDVALTTDGEYPRVVARVDLKNQNFDFELVKEAV